MTHDHDQGEDQAQSTYSGGVRWRPWPCESCPGSSTPLDFLNGCIGANPEVPEGKRNEVIDWLKKWQAERLLEWVEGCEHTQGTDLMLPRVDEGSEHIVLLDAAKSEVVKITRPGIYGDYYEIIEDRITQFDSTPGEYLLRMEWWDKLFSNAPNPFGMTATGQIVSRQKFISGERTSVALGNAPFFLVLPSRPRKESLRAGELCKRQRPAPRVEARRFAHKKSRDLMADPRTGAHCFPWRHSERRSCILFLLPLSDIIQRPKMRFKEAMRGMENKSVLRIACSILSVMTLCGCFGMALNQSMNRLEAQHRAGQISEGEYQSRHGELQARLDRYNQELDSTMAQAQGQGAVVTSGNYTQTTYVQNANSRPSGSSGQGYTPTRYVQSASVPQPSQSNAPMRYVQNTPTRSNGQNYAPMHYVQTPQTVGKQESQSYTPMRYVQNGPQTSGAQDSQSYTPMRYVQSPQSTGGQAQAYTPMHYVQNSTQPSGKQDAANSPSKVYVPNRKPGFALPPQKIQAHPAIVLDMYEQNLRNLANTSSKVAAFRRWWDAKMVPFLASKGIEEIAPEPLGDLINKTLSFNEPSFKDIVEGASLFIGAMKEVSR